MIKNAQNSNSDLTKKETTLPDNINDLIFQISDWDYYHEDIEIGNEIIKKYIIRIYGTIKDGDQNKKIFVKVKNYTPYFYVEIPKHWSKQKTQILIDTVKREVLKFKPDHVNSLKSWETVDKNIFWEFTNYKFFTFVRLIFHSYDGFKAYERIFNRTIKNILLDPKPKKYKLYESNIEPLLRCMHIRKINSVGWVKINGGKYNHFSTNNNPSINDIGIYTDWTNLDPIDDNTIVPLIIAAFDLECTSGDGSFPQPQRDDDKIIQIGTTFSRYGEDECYFKHIITLGSCDPIDGVAIESYNNEAQVLLAWTALIKKMNPDIITGYNIFGFDYKYLEERAKKLGCYTSFSKLGRIKNEVTPFIEKSLMSSALGNNKLNYYAMQGRIQIDIMKVIMRDFKLGSYKLDNVAAEFIRDEIIEIIIDNKKNQTLIKTKNNIYGLEVNRYIKIYFNDGLSDNSYKNEMKFKVLSVNDKSFVINDILDGEALEIKKFKVYWCQAKDDVEAKDIFRLQKGTSADRAIIAYYCVQDSSLCNKLINKLQIITNNVGMANVCHVPLSYIFLRGQGIKIFSLVSKKCRERNHVIPVIRKPYKPFVDPLLPPNFTKKQLEEKKEEEELNEGYEGATVFEPHVGIHYEPITVLDYNSLYPNSMRFRNISHECIVKDKRYDNLPKYYYENVTYANKDGTTTTCRYAKAINGPMGILPEILTELLDARNRMKDLAEIEKDPFKKKILDGVQLALKITANSLYGQTGAPTSAIYKRDIAASTCATGRELLNVAKIFAQIIFPILVNSILFEDYQTYEKKINLLFQKKIDELIGQKNVNELKIENKMINIWGNIMLNDNGSVIIEEAKYKYLTIFTDNRDPINDTKFINKKLKHTSKNDFIKWLYDETNTLLGKYTINPIVIYGDSIDEKESLMLLNENNQIEFKAVKDVCDQWQSYDNFKTDKYNEYYMDIINVLFKNENEIMNIQKEKKNNIIMNQWLGGKYMGSINKNKYGYCGRIGKGNMYNNIKTIKFFGFNKFEGKENAMNKVKEYLIDLNNKHNLIKNQYRKIYDINNNYQYFEVKLGDGNKTMFCDTDDLDIIEKYTWNVSSDGYVKITSRNYDEELHFHKYVFNKLINKLPNIIKDKIKNLTIDHINRNKLDNRKINLRLATQKEQMWNQNLYKSNNSGIKGIYYNEKRNKWIVNYRDINGKCYRTYCKTKKDAINERKKKEIIILDILENKKKIFIEELKQFLIEDQKNRYSKEQSQTNYKIYTDEGWKNIKRLIRHKTNKKMFRIITNCGTIVVTEDHSLIDINGNYLTPKQCIIGTELLHSFPVNIQEYEFDIKDQKYYNIETFINSDKVECMKYYCVSKKLGYNVKIDIVNDDFILNRTKEVIKDPYKIIKIIQLNDINEDKYVYDLECENGKFNAGIGEITVKNTDSIFINYQLRNNGEKLDDKISLKISIELGQLTSVILHKILPVPQNMLYEKTFMPYAILSKKRYVGNKYEFDPNKYYQNSMGITLKRRDNAPIVKIVVGGIVRSILNEKNTNKAIEYTKKTLKNILSGKYPLDKFIITKTLKGNALTHNEREIEKKKLKEERTYSDRTRIVHAVLADRIADRDPGNKPQSNERIPYAYVVIDKEVALQGERVEHPEYILEKKMAIDYLFYITNQIMKPSLQFLKHIIIKPEKIFKHCIVTEMNRRTGKRPLTYYFNLLDFSKMSDNSFADCENDEDADDYEDIYNDNNSKEFTCYDDKINSYSKEIVKKNIIKKKKNNKNIKQIKFSNFNKNKDGFILEM